MDLPKISVIVPIYNAVRYLSACLDSIKNQTLNDIEIILVDDGSTDGSSGLCDASAADDDRICVIHQANLGSTAARKAGLRSASAKYVTFVDSDDWIEADLCQSLFDEMTCHGTELVIGAHFIEQDGSVKVQRSSLSAGFYDRNRLLGEIFPVLFHNDFEDEWTIYPYLCGKLFLREKLLPFQEQADDGIGLGDDVCVTFPYLVHCDSLVIVERPFYHYVQHEESQFRGQVSEKDLARFRIIYRMVSNSWRGEPYAMMLQDQLRRYMLTTILLPRAPMLLSGGIGRDKLFPFQGIRSKSKVILYGAGILGTACYRFLQERQYAELVFWVDARAEVLRQQGFPVKSLNEVTVWPDYDYVLVAVMKQHTAEHICKDLIQAGVVADKIRCVDEKHVLRDEVWQVFCMEENGDIL